MSIDGKLEMLLEEYQVAENQLREVRGRCKEVAITAVRSGKSPKAVAKRSPFTGFQILEFVHDEDARAKVRRRKDN